MKNKISEEEIKNIVRTFVSNVFFFGVFIFLIIVSLYGVLIPHNSPAISAGNMQITPYKYGLYLDQNQRKIFYNFSPLNDFILNNDNSRNNLLTTRENYKSSFESSYWKGIIDSIKGYLNPKSTSIYFNGKEQIMYTATTQGNKFTITRDVAFSSNNNSQKTLSMTMSFNGDDFVYDKSGNLYNGFLISNVEQFEKSYGISLNPSLGDLLIPIKDNVIFISNPNVAGTIAIKAKANQQLFVNINTKLIEIQEKISSKNGVYETSLNGEIFQNPKEALSL